ncbi:MAG: NHLP family bacteriocin export ABC transporter permease/ATPase subunit, partial [Lachnospiraceae bacterium]|nr:NHLP family bacteriocin export ABC transporter permease/ATPase subunit [Candidatus Darwinimomas equi]
FDEATSALDNRAQSILCDTLEKRHNTRIAIAHRLTTVEKCDRVIVLDHGRIVEEGSYSELAKAGGVFERMIEEQELFNQQNF